VTEIDSAPQTVRRLVELVTEHQLTELVLETDGTTITVRAEQEAPVQILAAPLPAPSGLPSPSVPTAAPLPATTPAPAPSTGRPANSVALESPMVGVFYRSASPDDPAFVVVGDIVKVGQPIGLIEAMKVFSEVPAEVAGRVVETPVESGKLVQQGQPLIYVEPA
jgi:acetyl-CoA carboxylase biotin carboxyl carrier protein